MRGGHPIMMPVLPLGDCPIRRVLLEGTVKGPSGATRGGVLMRAAKRFAIAFGSILALVLAGGAHWKAG